MAGITKRVTRLSDGRELIYFDDAETRLGLRQDPLTGEWISIAAARQGRAFIGDIAPEAAAGRFRQALDGLG